MPLLEINNLTLEFGAPPRATRVLEDVSFSLEAGETLCLVGESGSGKSVTAMSIGRLLPSPPARYAAGQILLEGRNVLEMTKAELRAIRGGVVGYVFQEPAAALNPVMRVGEQIREMLRLHRPERATAAEVVRLLKMVGIAAPEHRQRDYPHQMSGGMQQRIMIAMALAAEPKVLVADEPTTALDVTIQAQILDLLRELQRRLGMALLFITHNLALVSELADRVAVMYAGQIVESGPARAVLDRPLHPYTRALLESVPQLGADRERLKPVPGVVPAAGEFPAGCRFHPRCDRAEGECRERRPELLQVEAGRWVRCPLWRGA
jgi:peptide/nickel transport system ATP-binding protein/oligopeptide transport system ATP-binding protein